jgi:asparagine synthase (glutamine-hydrolysing)
MNRQIVHRGPDDDGFLVQGNVGLAMRRLSIIDLASGHQPIANEDETLWIVYNGEIYNHRDLRQGLAARGHRYRTHSDTETILHLYEEHGRECVQHLRGMFAFAIWDSRARQLFIARDRLGIKPLYYYFQDGVFAFGSEIKAILAHPNIRSEFNRGALAEYLAFGYLSGEQTMYRGIRKLMPGHWLEIGEQGGVSIAQYWDVPVAAEKESLPRRAYITGYRDLLEHSVSSHLMSDVPLGVFLSGGLDSSAVAALATKIRGGPVETFAVGYEEDTFSELPFARAVAGHIGSQHREVKVSRQDFMGALPRLIWHEDEPICWPSSVALYFVSRLASERVKVVLTGEGSDETLAGYTRYAWMLRTATADRVYRAITPSAVRGMIRDGIARGTLPASLTRKLEHTFLARDGASWSSAYFDNFYTAFSASHQAALLTPEMLAAAGDAYASSESYWNHSSGPLLQRMLYTDIKTYLVELLMKQDQMSMAASVESRVPFLDHKLVEFALQIPGRYSVSGLAGKMILKSAVEDLLPRAIIHRKKMGFPTPWVQWLKGSLLDELESLLTGARALDRGLFRPETLRRLFAEHRAAHRDHSDRIWRLLNFELWMRACIEQEQTSDLAAAGRGVEV